MSLRSGDRCGRLVLARSLGRGGMGEVFLAEDPVRQAQVAVKIVHGLEPVLLKRFRREAEAQASVDAHPNVLRIHSAVDDPRGFYVVMEHAPGGDLATRLRSGSLAPSEAATLACALARGLAHVHSVGVLHRDLKPANVLFGADGTPKLADFGLARIAGAESLTATGSLVGTPAYMAPELAQGNSGDERSDVYGLGAILYECLTGAPPFVGASALLILSRVVSEVPAPPSDLRPGIPGHLEAICLRALEKDPQDRYPSAAAFADALAATAPPPTAGRVPMWAVGVAVLSCIALVGVALSEGGVRPPPEHAQADDPLLQSQAVKVTGTPPVAPPDDVLRLRYAPQYAARECPPLKAGERAKLETWRAAYARGSWASLGRRLDPNQHFEAVHVKLDSRLARFCYFEGWKQGDVESFYQLGRRQVEDATSPDSRSVGLEMVWMAGRLGFEDAQFVLAKALSEKTARFGNYGDMLRPSRDLSGAWLRVAKAGGADPKKLARYERNLVTALAGSPERARELLETYHRSAAWNRSQLFAGGPFAVPSARERVVQILRTRSEVIDPDRLRELLIGPPPSRAEIARLDRRRETFLNDSSWFALGRIYDPTESTRLEGVEPNMRTAAICYLEGVREGSAKALRRLGRYVRDGDHVHRDVELGWTVIRWAAIAGDTKARHWLAAPALSRPQEGGAWSFLSGDGRKDLASVPDGQLQRPQDADQAWGWIADALGAADSVAVPGVPRADGFPWVSVPGPAELTSRLVGSLEAAEGLMIERAQRQMHGGWFGFGKLLDPRGVKADARSIFGIARNARQARACYLRAIAEGSDDARSATLRLALSLLDRNERNSFGDRKLGLDLLLSLAIQELGTDGVEARLALSKEYWPPRALDSPLRALEPPAEAWRRLAVATGEPTWPDDLQTVRAAARRWVDQRAAEREAITAIVAVEGPLVFAHLEQVFSGQLDSETDRKLSALLRGAGGDWYDLGRQFDTVAVPKGTPGPAGHERNLPFALRCYVRAAANGDPQGLRRLGDYTARRFEGIPNEPDLGRRVLVYAAIGGDFRALESLARIYGKRSGYDTVIETADLELGGAWYRLSRGVGDGNAAKRGQSVRLFGAEIPADDASAWRKIRDRYRRLKPR